MAIEFNTIKEALGEETELPPDINVEIPESGVENVENVHDVQDVQNVEQEVLEAVAQATPSEELVIVQTPPLEKDPQYKSIEKILAKGLDAVFTELQQRGTAEAFKTHGEELTVKFRALIPLQKFDEADVYADIEEWLRMIDGVNAHFLLQESKRKADAIVKYLRTEIANTNQQTI